MTPEDFLAQQDLLRQMTTEMGPIYEILGTWKRSLVEDAGLGPDAADELVVTMAKLYVFLPLGVTT